MIGRVYYGALALALLAVLSIVGLLLYRAADARSDAREGVYRDSLTIARHESRQWQERASTSRAAFEATARSLDSLLATPPEVVYLRTRGRVDTLTVIDSIPYVSLADYDTLKTKCQRAQDDCTLALSDAARLDSARLAEIAAGAGITQELRDRLARDGRRSVLRSIRDVSLGAGLGAILCIVLCR